MEIETEKSCMFTHKPESNSTALFIHSDFVQKLLALPAEKREELFEVYLTNNQPEKAQALKNLF